MVTIFCGGQHVEAARDGVDGGLTPRRRALTHPLKLRVKLGRHVPGSEPIPQPVGEALKELTHYSRGEGVAEEGIERVDGL